MIDWVSDSASCFGGGGSVEADAGKPPVRWVPLHAPSTAEEEPEGRGEMEVALELLHSTLAEKRPAGQGRKSPNQHPQLEEPDRVSMLSLANPVHALRSLIGPGAAKYVAAGLCCFAFCLMTPLILSEAFVYDGAFDTHTRGAAVAPAICRAAHCAGRGVSSQCEDLTAGTQLGSDADEPLVVTALEEVGLPNISAHVAPPPHSRAVGAAGVS